MNQTLRLTHALRNRDTAVAAADALAGATGKIEVEGLVELLHAAPSAKALTTAISALRQSDAAIIIDGLLHCLRDSRPSIRTAALRELADRFSGMTDSYRSATTADLLALLQLDSSWTIRREALRALNHCVDHSLGCELIVAASDPHWRVRDELVRILLEERPELREQLTTLDDPRSRGVAAYLTWRLHGTLPSEADGADDDRSQLCPFWDWDPAVLAHRMQGFDEGERRSFADLMPKLIVHDDDRVRRIAQAILKDFGDVRHFIEARNALDEPRHPASRNVAELLNNLDVDRREQVDLARRTGPDLAANTPLDERLRLVRANGPRVADAALVSFQTDPHPYVRAAALTVDRASYLVKHPEEETSWHVLTHAARMMKIPFWNLEPDPPWQPEGTATPVSLALEVAPTTSSERRKLGASELEICPLGISGHYRMPVEGFVRAMEAGVDLMFWEPNYDTMIEFVTRLPSARRDALHLVAGTFEADGKRVRKDAERALRVLKTERLSLFLMFWVRSWARLSEEVRRTLEDLQSEGKIDNYSLSTRARK